MKLSDLVDEYVSYKRALGMRFSTDAKTLACFWRRLGDVHVESVTVDQVQAFLDGDNPVSSAWTRKRTTLVGLYRFALARGYASASVLPPFRPKLPPPLVPYIYSQAELKRLLDAAPKVCSRSITLDGYVLRTLILLLYGACLRHAEALRLTMKDVDLDQGVLCIRETKFYKSRLVPLGEHMSMALKQYVQQRDLKFAREPDGPLFCRRDGRPLIQSTVQWVFRQLCILATVRRQGDSHYQPRLHDLRHTGAVHRLIAWYRGGADLQRLLPQLATYLGHINLSATQHYLTLTPELLHEASLRFESYAMEAHHE
jgi:site-specific recombinase XerD